jgi:hypothetical protein
LDPVDDPAAKAAPRSLTVGGKPSQLINMRSAPAIDDPRRILVAVVQRDDSVFIIKLMGLVTSVNKQEKAFEDFLKSVRFKEDAPKN